MITDDEIRDLLQHPRPPATMNPDAALARAWTAYERRRNRLRTNLIAGTVAVAVVGIVLGSIALTPDRSFSTASPGEESSATVASWPTRGALANDQSLQARAQQTFAAQSTAWGDYRVARMLYAGGLSSTAETVVALEVTNQANHKSAAAFLMTRYGPESAAATSTAPLYLRSIVDLSGHPNPAAIGFVTSPLPADAPDDSGTLMISAALLNPRYAGHPASLEFSLYGPPLTDNPGAPAGQNADGLLEFPAITGSGPWNSSVVVDGSPIAAIFGGALGTPIPGSTIVLSQDKDAGHLAIAATADIRPGDAVFTATGLLGTVTTVTGGHATVDTNLTDTVGATTGTVEIYESHLAAHIVGTEGNYALTLDKKPGASAGWRVVLAGSQHNGIVINIGTPIGLSQAKTAAAKQIPFTRSVDPGNIRVGDTLMYLDLKN